MSNPNHHLRKQAFLKTSNPNYMPQYEIPNFGQEPARSSRGGGLGTVAGTVLGGGALLGGGYYAGTRGWGAPQVEKVKGFFAGDGSASPEGAQTAAQAQAPEAQAQVQQAQAQTHAQQTQTQQAQAQQAQAQKAQVQAPLPEAPKPAAPAAPAAPEMSPQRQALTESMEKSRQNIFETQERLNALNKELKGVQSSKEPGAKHQARALRGQRKGLERELRYYKNVLKDTQKYLNKDVATDVRRAANQAATDAQAASNARMRSANQYYLEAANRAGTSVKRRPPIPLSSRLGRVMRRFIR